jgi:predicted nucleic acid-binding protein
VAEGYKRPCFDSSVFIGALREEISNGIKRHAVFQFLWEQATQGKFTVYISAAALAEVHKKSKTLTPPVDQRSHRGPDNVDEFLPYANAAFVEVIDVDREVGMIAHELCQQHAPDLRPMDALHLACALRAKCDVLLVWDGPLSTIKHRDIRIEAPTVYDVGLFTESEFATDEEVKAYAAKLATELALADKDASEKQREERLRKATELAEKIVILVQKRDLASPFSTKTMRGFFTGQYDNALLNDVLPGFCAAGRYAGRAPKFKRVEKGKYTCL